jgi:hypothetical protein
MSSISSFFSPESVVALWAFWGYIGKSRFGNPEDPGPNSLLLIDARIVLWCSISESTLLHGGAAASHFAYGMVTFLLSSFSLSPS